jgi:erythromycin esterase
MIKNTNIENIKYSIVFIALLLNTFTYSQSEISTIDILEYESLPNHTDLQFLDRALENVQLVGIGESTHGTREFNLIYLKMFKYLVENHNFNTLFIEGGIVPCSRLDSYVKCENNCDSLTASIFNYWVWNTHEMNDLIQWIRNYNKSHQTNKISIQGIDIQDAKSIFEELNLILKISKIDTIALPEIHEVYNEVQIDKYRLYFSNQTNIDTYKEKLKFIDKDKVDYYSILLEYLNWNKIVSSYPKRGHLRDLAMGKNILSFLEKNKEAKGMLIAHNTHLFKYNKGKKNEMKNFVYAGGVLDKALGEKYYCIMQEFDGGCFNAYQRMNGGSKNVVNNYELKEVCIEKSIDNTIGSTLRDESKIMTFIKEKDLFQLMGSKMIRFHNIGAVFNPQKKNSKQTYDFFYIDKGKFDACIYHQHATATSFLKSMK